MPTRVKDENGNHITVAVVHAAHTVLEGHDATNEVGRWLPAKMQTGLLKPKAIPAETSKAKEAN